MTTPIRPSLLRSLTALCIAVATLGLHTSPLSAQTIPGTPTDTLANWAHTLQGRWGCSGAFASGRPLAADIEFNSTLRAHWLAYHHRDRAPGQYEATAVLGPTLPDSALVPTILYDNFGGHRRFRTAVSVADEITLARDTTETGARSERFTFRPRPDGTLWFAWEVQKQGGWTLGDSLSCHRDP